MWANNEVGTIQPIDEVVALASRARHPGPHRRGAGRRAGAGRLRRVRRRRDDVTGHKIGGPYGVGALLLRPRGRACALLHGGGQERDVRSGTIDAPAIVGFAAAAELAVKGQAEPPPVLGGLRDELVAGSARSCPT